MITLNFKDKPAEDWTMDMEYQGWMKAQSIFGGASLPTLRFACPSACLPACPSVPVSLYDVARMIFSPTAGKFSLGELCHNQKKENEKWKTKNEKQKMKNEKWKMKNEKRKMKNE